MFKKVPFLILILLLVGQPNTYACSLGTASATSSSLAYQEIADQAKKEAERGYSRDYKDPKIDYNTLKKEFENSISIILGSHNAQPLAIRFIKKSYSFRPDSNRRDLANLTSFYPSI